MAAITTPKYYADVCEQQSQVIPDYSDYEGFEVKFQSQDHYEIIKKIGRGKYSEVYEGINTVNNQRVVIKILKPVKKNKIRREIKILQTLKNGTNIVDLIDVVRDPLTKTPAIITEFVDSGETDFRKLY